MAEKTPVQAHVALGAIMASMRTEQQKWDQEVMRSGISAAEKKTAMSKFSALESDLVTLQRVAKRLENGFYLR